MLCGFLGIALYNALLNTGERTVTAVAASFIVNTLPIFTAVLAVVFLGERFNHWGWLGSLVSLAGIAVIARGQPGGLASGAGSTLILGAALCSPSYFVLQRRLIPEYGALTCTAYTLLAGALLLTPWLPGAPGSLPARRVARCRQCWFSTCFPPPSGMQRGPSRLVISARRAPRKFPLSDASGGDSVVDVAHGRATRHRDVVRRPDDESGCGVRGDARATVVFDSRRSAHSLRRTQD
jgi:hypothetical protein